jgi:hypothetical protein
VRIGPNNDARVNLETLVDDTGIDTSICLIAISI